MRITKKQVAGTIIIISLAGGIVGLLGIDRFTSNNTLDSNEIVFDTSESALNIKAIIEDVVAGKTDLRVVSNTDIETFEQSDLVIGSLGLDINDLTTFAVCADTRVESTFAIGVIKPKADRYEDCATSLINYVANKQNDAAKLDTSSDEYKNAMNALVYTYNEYIIIVMANNQDEILDNIVSKLNN